MQSFYDTLDETMKQGDELGFDGRYKKLEPVIHETFDVPVMAKIAVGAEWTNLTADEKDKLLEAFDRYMITTYAARFKTDKGQKFQVGEVKTPAENRNAGGDQADPRQRRSGCAQLPVPARRQRQLEDHRRLSERRHLRDGAHAVRLLRDRHRRRRRRR